MANPHPTAHAAKSARPNDKQTATPGEPTTKATTNGWQHRYELWQSPAGYADKATDPTTHGKPTMFDPAIHKANSEPPTAPATHDAETVTTVRDHLVYNPTTHRPGLTTGWGQTRQNGRRSTHRQAFVRDRETKHFVEDYGE